MKTATNEAVRSAFNLLQSQWVKNRSIIQLWASSHGFVLWGEDYNSAVQWTVTCSLPTISKPAKYGLKKVIKNEQFPTEIEMM